MKDKIEDIVDEAYHYALPSGYAGKDFTKERLWIFAERIERQVREEIAPWNDPNTIWVCEDHPNRLSEHRLFPFFWKRCGGAGMPKESKNSIGTK